MTEQIEEWSKAQLKIELDDFNKNIPIFKIEIQERYSKKLLTAKSIKTNQEIIMLSADNYTTLYRKWCDFKVLSTYTIINKDEAISKLRKWFNDENK